MSTDLHISLGHNSSAVLAIDGRVYAGFEQERFDKKKSSSVYPRDAINAILDTRLSASPLDNVYVSHWFDDFKLASNKYLDLDHLRDIAYNVISLTPEFTHHDAHAASAVNFLRGHEMIDNNYYVIVVDGFGNNQECFSFYEHENGENRLVHRSYGYDVSLGLMYQYATEYLGMRPNRDEYKLLGYEAHVTEYADCETLSDIWRLIAIEANAHAEHMLSCIGMPSQQTDQLINYGRLALAKSKWFERIDRWRKYFPKSLAEEGVRPAIAFCAQTFIEIAVSKLLDIMTKHDQTRPVLLTGGCFYNVKLNRTIQQRRHARVIAHPLAGDQGAALGFSHLPYSGLDWGYRDITGRHVNHPPEVIPIARDAWVRAAAELLHEGKIVNVVRRWMEYGPRALCNTTTFALPTRDSVKTINYLNDRDEAMPMAPVMTRSSALKWLRGDELAKIAPSDRYMITTCRFNSPPPSSMLGVAHRDPLHAMLHTARPQVTDDHEIISLLMTTPAQTLINTSFNYHGRPIVFSEVDAIETHLMQAARADSLNIERPYTLLVMS